jgi:hypothetical protein
MKLAILTILVTAALLTGTFECAASCAAVTSESPCHHDQGTPHHQDVAACSHELVLDLIHAPAVQHGFETSAATMPIPKNPHPDGWGCNAFSSDPHAALSCNRRDAGSSLSLRI